MEGRMGQGSERVGGLKLSGEDDSCRCTACGSGRDGLTVTVVGQRANNIQRAYGAHEKMWTEAIGTDTRAAGGSRKNESWC